MSAIKSQHSRLFERLTLERREKLIEALLSGVMPDNHMHQSIGEIRGLDAALKLSEEADFKLSGDEPQ